MDGWTSVLRLHGERGGERCFGEREKGNEEEWPRITGGGAGVAGIATGPGLRAAGCVYTTGQQRTGYL
jgi:hypothetical protein